MGKVNTAGKQQQSNYNYLKDCFEFLELIVGESGAISTAFVAVLLVDVGGLLATVVRIGDGDFASR